MVQIDRANFVKDCLQMPKRQNFNQLINYIQYKQSQLLEHAHALVSISR